MLRLERLGDDVFAAEPLSKIHQLAAFGAKWPERTGEPIAGFLASRALDRRHGLLGFGGDFLEAFRHRGR